MSDTEHLLERISFEVDADQLMRKVRMETEDGFADEIQQLAEEARRIAVPKAMYRLAFFQAVGDDSLTIDGVELHSRVLRVNLSEANRLFAYVATCGRELEVWSRTKTDPLEQYWADAIKQLALGCAIQALNRDIVKRYRPGKTSTMAPGSLADWPIQQQRPLFRILGDVNGRVGVELSPSYLMIPNKSISGIRFPREESFESCLLCPRQDCPARRAPHDPALYEREYGDASLE